ncbi:MAG: Gfo/Idh/MocA family protein [Phycisphaerae bacterium]
MQTRREVLAGAAVAFGATGVGGAWGQGAASGPAGEGGGEKKVGFAVVGIGKLTLGQILPAFANCKRARLAGFVTGHPEKAKPFLEKFKIPETSVYSYETYEKMAENPEIEAVYIVLPNGMHAEYTIRALKMGKHVLCEKPMANSPEECQQMIEAAKGAGRKLMVAYRVHFEPHNLKAIEICRNPGELGKLRFIHTEHTFHIGAGAWRLNKKMSGGGSLVDVGIYGLNATRYLTGEEPTEITAQIQENSTDARFKEVEEGLVWTMKFPSGVLATNITSYNAKNNNHHRLIFENGMIDMEPATGYHGIKVKAASPASVEEGFAFPEMDQFAAEMDHLAACVRGNKEVQCPGEEGLRDMKLMAGIYEAGRGGRVVRG